MTTRVALVTGSTQGIGAAVARRLSADGFAVALHSRASVEAGERMAAELPGASYTRADLSDEGETRGLISAVLQKHGRLDVLVNNAGEVARFAHADLKAATPGLAPLMGVNGGAVAADRQRRRRCVPPRRRSGRPASSTSARMPRYGPRARRSRMRPPRRRCIT